MALEPGQIEARSPVSSSGRVSPAPTARRWRTGEDEALTKDRAFKRYAAGVDQTLAIFEKSLREWADYVFHLGKLLKVEIACCTVLMRLFANWQHHSLCKPILLPSGPYLPKLL